MERSAALLAVALALAPWHLAAEEWAAFRIVAIRPVFSRPDLVRFQIHYEIPPSYPKPCFISATIPARPGASSLFGYRPAGTLPHGVPKGRRHFSVDAMLDLVYRGAGPFKSSTIDLVIYDKNSLLCSAALPWAKTWDSVLLPPGLVMGLRHNLNQQREGTRYIATFTALAREPVRRMDGGDEEAPLHRGYEWWMRCDSPKSHPAAWKLPPGVVLGLKHSMHQAKAGIRVFGRDPQTGPSALPGFRKQAGGDLGAPSGHGYFWYESTGQGFTDWSLVAKLPRWTVVGLKHSRNQRHKKLAWMGKVYDPADRRIAPPPGFARQEGGDRNGGSGEGFCWYEKVTGPEVVVRPTLRVSLWRSLLAGPGDDRTLDRDSDGLVDTLEGELANAFRPCLVFDSAEKARLPFEPVTLFQVRPVALGARKQTLSIQWIFLFKRDGGYGPDSAEGRDAHPGDADDGRYELESTDSGVTWRLTEAILATWKRKTVPRPGGWTVLDGGARWPSRTRLEVYELTHPIVYMSAHKHHEYFTRDHDHNDSYYSKWGLNDDVNGLGARFLVDLRSLEAAAGHYNNVGEPGAPHGPPFVNSLDKRYPAHKAWDDKKHFYGEAAGALGPKWMRHGILRSRTFATKPPSPASPAITVRAAAQPPTVPAGGSTTVLVVARAADGAPLPEATVTIIAGGGSLGQTRRAAARGTTDRSGAFRVAWRAPGPRAAAAYRLSIEVAKPGHEPAAARLTIRVSPTVAPGRPRIIVAVSPSSTSVRAGQRIRVRVDARSNTGQAVPAAAVTLRVSGGTLAAASMSVASGTTNRLGTYRTDWAIPARCRTVQRLRCSARVTKPGHDPGEASASVTVTPLAPIR